MSLMESGLELYLKENELNAIRKAKVGIAGCGGLGSNTAHALVRLGFRNFHLIDYDIVEPSNLNRQFFFYKQLGETKCNALKDNLLQINPNLNIKTSSIKINSSNIHTLFDEYEIVVEGFDKPQYKKILLEELSASKKIISASGLGNYWNTDAIVTHELGENLTIIGDLTSDVESGVSPLSPGVFTSSAKQAGAVLKMVLKDINNKC